MEITPELLEKYAKGRCTEEETSIVEIWMNCSDDDGQTFEDVPFSRPLDNRLRQKIRKFTSDGFPKTHKTNDSPSRWLIAASILLLVGVCSFFYTTNRFVNHKTGPGELKTVQLADGSIVTLNAMSELVVPKRFDEDTRTLMLQGEAFFVVSTDSLHPFIVKTETSRTEVLGTEFNLKAYQNETIKLTLQEGKVLFSRKGGNNNEGIVLGPDEQVVLENGTLTKKEANHIFSKAWMDKKLVFKGATFHEVCREIERFYGVKINVQKKGLHNRLYRGTHNDPKLLDVIQKISFVLNFKYKKEGNILIIY